MKKIRGILFVIGTAMLTAAMLAGCGGGDTKQTVSDMPKGEVSYPIETNETLDYWVRLTPALGTSVKNYGETEFAKEYQKRTGINIAYKHPAQGQEGEVLNLLIASGDLPDIIETDWLARNPDDSISKNIILRLNDYIEDYSPNLKRYLAENDDINKAILTDTGNYYVYPFVRNDDKLLSTAGFMLRSDWLGELGLEVPETISEWTNVLTKFKNKSEFPLCMYPHNLRFFAGAYGVTAGFYVDNGQVKFGEIESAYKDYVAQMHAWYRDGILHDNFVVIDNKQFNAAMLNGTSGATFGAGGGSLGLYLNSMKGENYDLVAAPFPVLEKGDSPKFGNKQFKYSALNGGAITRDCKNPALAARFLDYSYSEEGNMLNNFGVEGVSYEMVDGYPTYMDIITNNPDGLSMAQSLPLYVRAANEGPFVQDKRYIEQYYQLDQQKNALNVWSKNEHQDYAMPQITLTDAESMEYSRIMSEINTFCEERFSEFIMGTRSMSEYDSYVQDIKDMNIARAIEIYQTAYERFLERK